MAKKTLADAQKGDKVIVKGFTGIKLGVFEISGASDKSVTVLKKDGTKMIFSRKSGKQTNVEEGKEKYANSVIMDDGSYVQPTRKAAADKKADKKAADKKAAKKAEPEDDDEDEDEDEEEEEKPAPKKDKKADKKADTKKADTKKSSKKAPKEEEDEEDDAEYEEIDD